MPKDDTDTILPGAHDPDVASANRRTCIFIFHRDGAEQVLLHPDREFIIGRTRPSNLCVPDVSLSREHARFLLLDGKVTVEDLGSKNGTWIAGERITGPREIPRGADIQLGGVPVAVMESTAFEDVPAGLDRHERFRALLEHELLCARQLKQEQRKLSVLMVRAAPPAGARVSRWLARVREQLRSVHRIALYSPEAVEILLIGVGGDEALTIAARIAAKPPSGEPQLVVGVSCYPGASADAEELIEQSRRASREATAQIPVRPDRFALLDLRGAEDSRASSSEGVEAVVASPAMKKVYEVVGRFARRPISVLIQGECGTGKELVAQAVHAGSPRHNKPFKVLNCAAIPEQLVESELFGHVKGAFTGAVCDRKGIFEAADGGTVFLDEIGELPLEAQSKLLRVLETKRVTRLGSTEEVRVDVRLVAATNRDLEARCSEGTFRDDLRFRINAGTITLTPLRERIEDIEPLAERFLQRFNQESGGQVRGIEPSALALLKSYRWPGNVRELRNVIERAVALADNDLIIVEDLPENVRAAAKLPDPQAKAAAYEEDGEVFGSYDEQMLIVERRILRRALDATKSTAEAAALLQMPQRTLLFRMKKCGIKRVRGVYVEESPEPSSRERGDYSAEPPLALGES